MNTKIQFAFVFSTICFIGLISIIVLSTIVTNDIIELQSAIIEAILLDNEVFISQNNVMIEQNYLMIEQNKVLIEQLDFDNMFSDEFLDELQEQDDQI